MKQLNGSTYYRLTRLLRHLQIDLAWGDDRDPYFSNNAIRIPAPTMEEMLCNTFTKDDRLGMIQTVAHEIGHFIVAAPSRKLKRDYGIPQDRIDEPHWSQEECKTQMVAREICKWLDVTPNKVDAKHYWDVESAARWWEETGSCLIEDIIVAVETEMATPHQYLQRTA